MTERKKMRRAFVSLPDGVWKIIDEHLKGDLGEGESEIIRNIVIAYLSDKGYFMNEESYDDIGTMNDKINIMEKMLTVLISLLEENRTITIQDFDRKMKRKISES